MKARKPSINWPPPCEQIRVLHLSRNFGHQAAVQAGLAHARGDAIVLMDSDMQDAPEAIPRFLAKWQAGYDVVYAVRTGRKESLWKRSLFAAFHRLMSAVASMPLPAEAGIFGLIDRRVARQIIALGESDRYFPGLRSWVGFRQIGIVVERNARYDDRPRVSLFGLMRLAKTAMFSFSSFPLVIFHVIGLVAAMVFVGLGGFSVFCKLFTDWAIPGWTSHILTGSFFGALNALGISILGEYVIRIYDQVRGRPLYVVDRSVNVSGTRRVPSDVAGTLRVPSPDNVTPAGDEPYVDLMNEAMNLLNEGTITEDLPHACDDEVARIRGVYRSRLAAQLSLTSRPSLGRLDERGGRNVEELCQTDNVRLANSTPSLEHVGDDRPWQSGSRATSA